VTAEGDWAEFDEIMTRHEGKNISLIANASSVFTPKPMHLLSWNEFSSLLEVNVKGAYLTFRRLLPFMLKASRGTFISVLTSTVIHPAKGFTAYVTAKSALHGLTRAIACEYEPRGIRAFSVSPAFMETSLNAGWGEHLRAAITANAKPQDPKYVAATILALAESNSTKGRGENYPIE
jgi:3-oxoacyl-[acyl-carrier protein] reductase